MTLTVHAVSGAPIPWRVLCGLAFKGLDYKINYLQASKGEHKSDAFLKLNPRGTIPVLETGDLILRDSMAILAWLDRQYPTTPLFGASPEEAGRIWQITVETAEYFRSAQHAVFFPILVQGKSVREFDDAERNVAMEHVDAFRAELARLEALLEKSDFMFGPRPTAADAVAFPDVRTQQRAFETKAEDIDALGLSGLPEEFPRLEAWKQRIEAYPGIEKTMPPHWTQ